VARDKISPASMGTLDIRYPVVRLPTWIVIEQNMSPRPEVAEEPQTSASNQRRSLNMVVWIIVVFGIGYLIYDLTELDFSSRFAIGFDILGGWAFGLVTLCVVALFRKKPKHRSVCILALVLFYAGSYSALSASGGYYLSQSGNNRYTSGLSMSDVSIWHPQWLYWEPFKSIDGTRSSRGTNLGYFYAPLIVVDRAWIHPTSDLFAENEPQQNAAK
jgi:hypothetical protein